MSDSGPWFFAWCDAAETLDALLAALPALVHPGTRIGVMQDDGLSYTTSMDEAVAMIRTEFSEGPSGGAIFDVMLGGSKRLFGCSCDCYTEEAARDISAGPIDMSTCDQEGFLYSYLELAWGRGPRSIEAEAAVAWHLLRDDLEDLLLRLCAPDASGRVRTGACANTGDWIAPVRMCATYNADARDIARDLALSWLQRHDKEMVSRNAGLSLEALRARVEAAPAGARVPLKGGSERARSLSRETVLKALATPPATLLGALEAAAVPDEAWRAAEPRVREILALTSEIAETGEGPPTWQVHTDTRAHVRFLRKHAPFHVRRLAGGGVILATHPFRSLWPLWVDALFSLGLMP
ncbi:hypothetical protein BE17_20575 [Sorangium cellulosum]|uniref:Uncharacterized protein n=1 Tax=Sorangium cellulosum TaxID=56 RepID=A0A150RMZ6_SORCE|nr:hypothetical protein BE17_20575 [Sorangium cellulosum]